MSRCHKELQIVFRTPKNWYRDQYWPKNHQHHQAWTLPIPNPGLNIFGTQPNPHHGQNWLCVLKVGRFSCPVKKVTPKYGSTVKTLTLEILLTTFLWPSIHVGCMPFHFRQNFQWESFHRHRHRHPCPVHFSKNEKVEEKN